MKATLDVSTAKSMSEVALARAQAEIVARMAVQSDVLAYDYMASSNYINPYGYVVGWPSNNYNNVNYDFQGNAIHTSHGPWPAAGSPKEWAQNIANLFYDPRPPVFVPVSSDPTKPTNEFRYYVDLNRNGMFEGGNFRGTNVTDYPTVARASRLPVVPVTAPGEPEWIGVLADPTRPHSATNQFIGRYAYMVQPIGKTLDLNHIHNEAQSNAFNVLNQGLDLFGRNQGVGSWELNLAGYLRDLNTNLYDSPAYVVAGKYYDYRLPNLAANSANGSYGYCFDDARGFLTNRLGPADSLSTAFGTQGCQQPVSA